VKTSFPDAGRRGAPQNAQKLENELRDVQDIDFTVEEGKLYFLQTRSAKRAPLAAVRIAMDLVKKGLIDSGDASKRPAKIDLDHVGALKFKGDAVILVQRQNGPCGGRCAPDGQDSAASSAAARCGSTHLANV
jgi:pyruvate,orthophosphate dikinase